MTLQKLVWRNITRRRGRFVFTLLGITIGMAAFVTFLALGGSLRREIQRESTALGANLIVTPKGSCAFEQVSILTGEQLPTNMTDDEVAAVRAIDGLTVIPFLAERSAFQNRPVSVLGIEPQPTLEYKRWRLADGGYFPDAATPGVVAGAVAAEQFGLRPGATVTIRGEQLPLFGVLAATGSKDDVSFFLPLETAQRLYQAEGRVSFLAVRVADLDQVDQYALRIREATTLGVVSDKQMLASVLSIVGSVHVTMQLIAAVALLAAAFGIVNTMLTATYERKREIGILQALGASRRTIFVSFLAESGLYGVIGGVLGVGAGLLFSLVAAPQIGQNIFMAFVKGTSQQGLVDPLLLGGAVLVSALLAMLAGVYPAWRAARLSPVEAISYE